MRYSDFGIEPLMEKTVLNQQVAESITDLIIDNMPSQLPAGEMIEQYINHFYKYRQLRKTYEGTPFEKAVNGLEYYRVIWTNADEFGNTAAMYVSNPVRYFQFMVSSFLQKAGDTTKQEILTFRSVALPIKTFRALVLHEVRHHLQAHTYSGFFHSSDRKSKFNYTNSPVEIDAAWAHNLEDHPYGQYTTAVDYVTAVMASFASYKTLNPAQMKHYRAKTAAYWMARTRGWDDKSAMSLGDRMAARRKEMAASIVRRLGTSEVDLRNVPGYSPDAARFLFPADIFRRVSANITKGEKIAPDLAPIVFLAIALSGVGDDARMIERHLNSLGITLDHAIAHSEKAFRGGFDADALRDLIVRTFR
jgi:hypothetical protein